MKRIAAIVAAALVGLTACNNRQPAPGAYTYRDGGTVHEIHIVHGDCVAYNLADSTGMLLSIGPFETKGRYPHYTYRYRQGESDFTITASFEGDGLQAKLYGVARWSGHRIDVETPNPLPFSANSKQSENE